MHRREALLHIDHRFNEHTYRDKRNHFDEGYPPSFVTRHTWRLRTQLCERRQHFTAAGKPAGTRGRGGEPSPAAASQGRNYSAGSDQSRPKIPSEHFERGLFVFQVYAALLGPRGPSSSTRRACCYLAGPWGPWQRQCAEQQVVAPFAAKLVDNIDEFCCNVSVLLQNPSKVQQNSSKVQK